MKINGIKLLIIGLALLLGGFGTFILSIYSLIPFSAYTGVIGTAAFIIGLGFTALAATKITMVPESTKNHSD
ncbi:hypothetical protein [Ferroplasma sp.]|uniref:hypothetical protein n=1 Tax=Ferroplasma sp. TaxID=2591003 RepID=UPI00307F1D19